MQLSIRAPTDLPAMTGVASVGRAIQSALHAALAEGTPQRAPDARCKAVSVYLPASLTGPLSALDADVAGLAGRLLSGWAHAKRQRDKASPPPASVASAFALRREQTALVDATLPLLLEGNIAFAEASTGVGKSRVLAVLAQALRARQYAVTIAAPTIEVMLHVAREFEALGLAAPAIYLGRRQFVSQALLADLLADAELELPEDERARLLAWDGQPATEKTRELAQRAGGANWLLADLEALAPSVAADLVACEDEDATPDAYAQMLALWHAAPVRLATHALVAVMAKHPREAEADAPPEALLVDEAHLLHAAIEEVCLGQFSFFKLRAFVRPLAAQDGKALKAAGVKQRQRASIRRAAQSVVMAIDSLLDGLRGFGTGRRRLNAPGANAATVALASRMAAAAADLAPHLSALRGLNIPGMDRIAGQAQDVCRRLSRESDIQVTLSPTRRYPTVRMNYGSVTAALDTLWDGARCGLLLSATLFVETATGPSAGYFVNRLRTPILRVREIAPIVAPWLYATPTLHLPAGLTRAALVPQGSIDKYVSVQEAAEAEGRYYDALAQAILYATHDAAGGTLVLCTGYQAIRLLTERLDALGDRLLEQVRGPSFSRWPHTFRERAGLRPVWLATGAAWTGLDLRDGNAPAAVDRLLTDVIVTRIPYFPADEGGGTPKMRDYQARTEAALRFRQGMGRLVRAEGQPDRRLWVLDGRLWSARPWDRLLAAPCLKALARYPKQREFTLPAG